MKKIISVVLTCVMFLTACTSPANGTVPYATEAAQEKVNDESASKENLGKVAEGDAKNIADDKTGDSASTDNDTTTDASAEKTDDSGNTNRLDIAIKGLDDEALLGYVEDNIYSTIVSQLNSEDYFIENVEAIYYPKEYIEALASNSQSNRYFGFTSAELNEQFQGTQYVFTLGEDGQTVVVPMETVNDDVYIKAMEDVIIGTGVILICVTVSVVATPAAPAVGMIFAASASTGTVFALESGAIGFAAAAIAKGYETESFEQAMKAAVEAGAEGFKWGAVIGAATGGVKEATALKGATLNGLTMNEAARIQKESRWTLEAIKSLHSTAEYDIYKKIGLKPTKLNDGTQVLLREIDWSAVDSYGRTNIERVSKWGLAPIDETGVSYELHHVGMKADSPLAILTKAEHHSKANYSILHWSDTGKGVADEVWEAQKDEVWKAILEMARKAGLA